MRVINHYSTINGNTDEQEVATVDELWELVHSKFDSEFDDDADGVLEVSANTDTEGAKYLVLTWVELEEA
jgi:hypothetical protein